MPVQMEVELVGMKELVAHLDKMPSNIQDRIRPFIAQETIALRDGVKGYIASYFRSTGRLYNAVQTGLTEEPGAITGRVFIDDVPYAGIQERGGKTSAHTISPVRATVLAFMAPGKMQFKGSSASGMVFAKKVNHPGSNIPEHPYARRALADRRVPFREGIRAIVNSEARGKP